MEIREKLHNCNVLKLIGKLVRDWNYHNKVCLFLWRQPGTCAPYICIQKNC